MHQGDGEWAPGTCTGGTLRLIDSRTVPGHGCSVAELKSATITQLPVPNAGHFPWIERSKLVLATVTHFIN